MTLIADCVLHRNSIAPNNNILCEEFEAEKRLKPRLWSVGQSNEYALTQFCSGGRRKVGS